jgi:hypothetical protein
MENTGKTQICANNRCDETADLLSGNDGTFSGLNHFRRGDQSCPAVPQQRLAAEILRCFPWRIVMNGRNLILLAPMVVVLAGPAPAQSTTPPTDPMTRQTPTYESQMQPDPAKPRNSEMDDRNDAQRRDNSQLPAQPEVPQSPPQPEVPQPMTPPENPTSPVPPPQPPLPTPTPPQAM